MNELCSLIFFRKLFKSSMYHRGSINTTLKSVWKVERLMLFTILKIDSRMPLQILPLSYLNKKIKQNRLFYNWFSCISPFGRHANKWKNHFQNLKPFLCFCDLIVYHLQSICVMCIPCIWKVFFTYAFCIHVQIFGQILILKLFVVVQYLYETIIFYSKKINKIKKNSLVRLLI